MELIYSLSLSHESEIVLSHCSFRDLHGTVDNSRYCRSVGVSYCFQKLFVDFLENDGVFGS